jgi:hypothetical protein
VKIRNELWRSFDFGSLEVVISFKKLMLELEEYTWWKRPFFMTFLLVIYLCFQFHILSSFFNSLQIWIFIILICSILYFCKFVVVIDLIMSMKICYNTKHELQHDKKINIYHLITILKNEFGGKKSKFYNFILIFGFFVISIESLFFPSYTYLKLVERLLGLKI